MTIHPPTPTPPTCKATMAMHYMDSTYAVGTHTVHTCTTTMTQALVSPAHTHACTCGRKWTSVPADGRCHACGTTAKDLIEVTDAQDDDGTPLIMCIDFDQCMTRVHANSARGGEGLSRKDSDPETPRPVANSLSEAGAFARDEITRLAREQTAAVLAEGRTPFVATYREDVPADTVHLPEGQPDSRAPWMPGFSRHPSRGHAIDMPVRGRGRAVDFPPNLYGRRRFMSDDRFNPGLQVSEVESYMERGKDLQGLWQRTVDIIKLQAESLAQLADLLDADPPGPPPPDRKAVAADLNATVLELLTARINVERLRPASEADVAGQLVALRASVDAVRRSVAEMGTPAAPKPASYTVDGLTPHNYRDDGSSPDGTGCTWRLPGKDGLRCGYGANAMVHRRTAFLGKNAPGAAVDEPSTQDDAS